MRFAIQIYRNGVLTETITRTFENYKTAEYWIEKRNSKLKNKFYKIYAINI